MRLFVVCLLIGNLSGPALAQANKEEDVSVEEKATAVHAWADRVASEIQVRPAGAATAGKLVEGSLIRWSNPIADDVFGDCYLWTFRGRPIAFLSVYAFFAAVDSRRLTFQSLSEQPLFATRNEARIWTPELSGIAWLALGDLPPPGTSSPVRQRQMKAVALSFAAEISERGNPKSFRSLRMLAKPLHKYQCEDQQVRDGAVFAFVDGTDPELLLMIECVGGSTAKMRVAAVRQNHRHLRLQRGPTVAWEAAQIAPPFPNPKISDPAGVYYNAPWKEIAAKSEAP